MDLNTLNSSTMVERDDFFLPIVFADLPSMICTGALYMAGKQLTEKIDDARKKIDHIVFTNEERFVTIPLKLERSILLKKSISDISFD